MADILPLQPPNAASDVLLPACSEDLLGVRPDRMRHVLAELCCKSGFPSGLSADIPVSAELMMVNIDLIRAACDRSISRTPAGAPAAEIIAADLRTPVKRAFHGIATKQSAPLRFSWHLVPFFFF